MMKLWTEVTTGMDLTDMMTNEKHQPHSSWLAWQEIRKQLAGVGMGWPALQWWGQCVLTEGAVAETESGGLSGGLSILCILIQVWWWSRGWLSTWNFLGCHLTYTSWTASISIHRHYHHQHHLHNLFKTPTVSSCPKLRSHRKFHSSINHLE